MHVAEVSEPYEARVKTSLEDVTKGRVKRGTASDLIKELELNTDRDMEEIVRQRLLLKDQAVLVDVDTF